MTARLLLGVMLALQTSACGGGDFLVTKESSPIAFQTLAKGNAFNRLQAGYYVIRNESDWRALAPHFRYENTEKVDFADSMLIVAFLGERRTGGYAVTISDISDDGDKLTVMIKKRAPQSGSLVTQALTSPFHLIKTAASDKPAVFIDAPEDY